MSSDDVGEIARTNLILRGIVGSTVHGLAIDDQDDRDEMGICIEPPEYALPARRQFANHGTYQFRTAEQRQRHVPVADQRYHGRTPPSQPGDLDLQVHTLRKYCYLAAAGNPSILLLLFTKPLEATAVGRRLQGGADMFASRQAGLRFLGYLRAQKERLLGRRGQMRVTRNELIAKHGYDTKYAGHVARLAYQGIEYMGSGRISLPMPEKWRQICLWIRRGEASFEAVIDALENLEERLVAAIDRSSLPEHPDHDRINRFMVGAYLAHWMDVLWQQYRDEEKAAFQPYVTDVTSKGHDFVQVDWSVYQRLSSQFPPFPAWLQLQELLQGDRTSQDVTLDSFGGTQ